jgi:hypothetical protein
MPAKLKPPPFPAIQKLHGVPRELQEIQQNIATATEAARKNPENSARVVESVEIPASGTVRIPHKLGKKPIGYSVTRVRTGAPAFTEGPQTSRFSELVGTSAAIVDLKVW